MALWNCLDHGISHAALLPTNSSPWRAAGAVRIGVSAGQLAAATERRVPDRSRLCSGDARIWGVRRQGGVKLSWSTAL